MNKKAVISVFVFLFILSILLYLNRYGLTNFDDAHAITFCNNCEMRHILEHFEWGFVFPTLAFLVIWLIFYLSNPTLERDTFEYILMFLASILTCVYLAQLEVHRAILYSQRIGFISFSFGLISSLVWEIFAIKVRHNK